MGRLVPQKGSDLVSGVIPKLLRATEAQIVVAGDGETSLVKKMEEAAGKAVEQPLTKAIKLETREAAGALFFESRRVPSAPGAEAAWVHRNYIAK